jgi:ATP-dependent helicase YprA (DUF1998 family)
MTIAPWVSNALTAIERRELRLIAWGLTDGGLTDSELRDALQNTGGGDPDLARDLLVRLGVIASHPTRTGFLWRSRTGETVRLLASLRQWMGRGHLLDTWRTAPTLVSDFRFFIAEKRRPRREIPAADVCSTLDQGTLDLSSVQRKALQRLLRLKSPSPYNLCGYQVRSTQRVLTDLCSDANRGSVVCAGTGTGKTLAFYLPALTYLAGLIDGAEWTRALLVYPRNELLKDQFATAFTMCRTLDGLFAGQRKITVGALYGETPGRLFGDPDQRLASLISKGWEPFHGGALCPYLRCPGSGSDACGGHLHWSRDDLGRELERLRCLSCGKALEPDEIRLTRGTLQDHPPDLLFTNMDQVNRRLCDHHLGRPIGVGARRPPLIVLLDEAHTYEGSFGAQAALTLRRWRHAVARGNPVVFVGLSATLAAADAFFADLTGLRHSDVIAVEPRADELEVLGAEYLGALRADATSGASVLATTIQTAMLIRRALDPDGAGPSNGLVGSQVFCFTETLDLVNRLQNDLHDAENRLRLAALRWVDENAQDYNRGRHFENRLAGHSWDLPRALGHRFSQQDRGARIVRVSSQDRGLDAEADIVVATASLEVGYDSDAVGAVIQHKAPRSGASFLQRVGRAGRPAPMRPWKIAVLSDFGRDRAAFQSAEDLFSPEITARPLPRSNRYVLRMQAAMALLDWLAAQLRARGCEKISVWQMCAQPYVGTGAWNDAQHTNQATAVEVLGELLGDNSALREQLARYIASALREPRESVDRLLWEPPRPILRAAVPTLLRRLSTGWAFGGQSVAIDPETKRLIPPFEAFTPDHPIPEFVPRFLSSDLVLPEVEVCVGDFEDPIVLQAEVVELVLSTFSPGNVTMRYSPMDGGSAHWIPDDDFTLDQRRVAGQVLPARRVQLRSPDPTDRREELELDVLRPHRMLVDRAPTRVSKSSKSAPIWASSITPSGPGFETSTPDELAWAGVVRSAQFLTHAGGAWAEVTRAAVGARGRVQLSGRGGDSHAIDSRFQNHDGHPIALGFEYQADAVRFCCQSPPDLERVTSAAPGPLERRLRIDAFRARVEHDPALPVDFNVFQRRHAAEVFVAAVTAWAEARDVSLAAAVEQIRSGPAPLAKVLDRAVRVLFRSSILTDESDEGAESDNSTSSDVPHARRARELLEVLGSHEVADVILEHAGALSEPIEGPWWRSFLRARFAQTLGAALHDAATRLDPAADSDAISLDPLETDDLNRFDLWLTERSPGGTGVVEALYRAYTEDPHRFFSLLTASLAPSGPERVVRDFERLLVLLGSDVELDTSLHAARAAVGVDAGEEAARAFFDMCAQRGLTPTHRFRVMVGTRLVQHPASDSSALLELLRQLLSLWDRVEKRHGIEIDTRLIAYLATADPACRDLLARSVGANAALDDPPWVHARLSALLWRRGGPLRQATLEVYQRFVPQHGADRLLLLAVVGAGRPALNLGEPDWQSRLSQMLAQHPDVDLVVPDGVSGAATEIAFLLGSLFDTGFLRLPIALERVERDEGSYRLGVRLAGALR